MDPKQTENPEYIIPDIVNVCLECDALKKDGKCHNERGICGNAQEDQFTSGKALPEVYTPEDIEKGKPAEESSATDIPEKCFKCDALAGEGRCHLNGRCDKPDADDNELPGSFVEIPPELIERPGIMRKYLPAFIALADLLNTNDLDELISEIQKLRAERTEDGE